MSLSSSSSSSLFCPQLKASFKAIIVELNEQITQRQPVDQASYLKRVQELIGQQRMQWAETYTQLKPYLSAAYNMPEVKVDQSSLDGINKIRADLLKGLARDKAYQHLQRGLGSEVWDRVRHQVEQGSGNGGGGGHGASSAFAPPPPGYGGMGGARQAAPPREGGSHYCFLSLALFVCQTPH